MGPAAVRARADVLGALGLGGGGGHEGWETPVLMVSSARREGVEELIAAIDTHAAALGEAGRLTAIRHIQAEAWLEEAVRERFGREGVRRAAGELSLPSGASPFARLSELSLRLGFDSKG
jgi:LAO/AO transport system kinase